LWPRVVFRADGEARRSAAGLCCVWGRLWAGFVTVGFAGDEPGGEAGLLLPEVSEEGVELRGEGVGGLEDAVTLAERFGDVDELGEAARDGRGGGAEVAEVAAEEGAAVLVEGVLAEVAGEVGGVGVERGASGVLDGAVAAMELVDAVGAVAEGAAGGVVLAGIKGVVDDGGVDDGAERVAVGVGEGVAGEAE